MTNAERKLSKAASASALVTVTLLDGSTVEGQVISPAPGSGLVWVRPVELTGRELTGALLVSKRSMAEWPIPSAYGERAADLAAGRLPTSARFGY